VLSISSVFISTCGIITSRIWSKLCETNETTKKTSYDVQLIHNKRKSSSPNAINCTNIECHGIPPIGFQNMQTDLNKFSSVANNECIHLLSWYSTNCSPTELLELQPPMTKIQRETVSILSFLNEAIQRPLSYEQHIMNQKLACANKKN